MTRRGRVPDVPAPGAGTDAKASAPGPVLEAYRLVKRYHAAGAPAVTALDGVSLRIEPGEFVALSGPSGCGKSTLLSLLGLAESPTSGSVSIRGETADVSDERGSAALRRSLLGFVFQDFQLLPTLTARENVMLTSLLAGATAAEAGRRADELLASVGLGHRGGHLPSGLSGGEAQRAAVCRAVAHRPAVVLADEPTGNLDSRSGEAVLDLLAGVARGGTAVLMATHGEAALSRADRVVRLLDGRVADPGTGA